MPADLVGTAVAGVAVERSARAVQLAVRAGRLRNYSEVGNVVMVSLGEVLDLYGDPRGLR